MSPEIIVMDPNQCPEMFQSDIRDARVCCNKKLGHSGCHEARNGKWGTEK